ncbi:DUF2231 domain-containing protein [Methylomonas sp. SURF-1]|uniref:DUF2231 domain-containing protein n=1 Tax=Methylomonas aurea TaxID=2952224 RepID=A0ABT1UJG7_9GAMM|nr:DUF2231 domain-containing protein [Methylomonas sp. SURF-1]MCQ8182385.1 DUF2231 domain-containing protein [Methylomonas sp. SURF-1]
MLELGSQIRFSIHGGADSGGVAGGVEALLSFLETALRQSPGETFEGLLPGISALQNLHPLFVHFPIALLSLFFAVDLAGSLAARAEWRRVAGWLLYLGVGFAGITATFGFIAADTVAHGGDVHEIMENHEHLGVAVFGLAAFLAVWRGIGKTHPVGPANAFYLLLAGLLAGLLAFTADLGGLMVYKYGVAVEAAADANRAAALEHEHGAPDFDQPVDHEEPVVKQELGLGSAIHQDDAPHPQAEPAPANHLHQHEHNHKHGH